jgi:Replication-relaxation
MSPIAGPLASSSEARKAAASAGVSEIRTPKLSSSLDSLPRISSTRLDLIASLLTPTDHAVLELVSRTRLCSGAQLERLFWHEGSPASRARQARRVLSQLVGWRVLDRLPRQVGGRRAGSRGFVYCLGPSGARLLARESGRRPRRLDAPGERYVSHILAASEQVVRLHEASRAGTLELIEVQSEPACWREFVGPFGARRILKPDLFVRVGAGAYEYRWAIEIDMATEARGTLHAKCWRYVEHYRSGSEQRSHGTYPRVLWASTTEQRAGQLREMIARLPGAAARLFTVCRQDELVALLAKEAHA